MEDNEITIPFSMADFLQLRTKQKNEVLKALLRNGQRAYEDDQGAPGEASETIYRQIVSWGDAAFAELNGDAKRSVLLAFRSLGSLELKKDRGPSGKAKALAWFRKAVQLAYQAYASLSFRGHFSMMALLFNIRRLEHEEDVDCLIASRKEELTKYVDSVLLKASKTCSIEHIDYQLVLTALNNAGYAEGLIDTSPNGLMNGLTHFYQAAQLGEAVFSSLSSETQYQVFLALTNAASFEVRYDSGLSGQEKALACHKRVASLGEPVFASLSPETQIFVLHAISEAGNCVSRLEPGLLGSEKELSYCLSVTQLGEPLFSQLAVRSQEFVLMALHRASSLVKGIHQGAIGTEEALKLNIRGIQLGEAEFYALDDSGKGLVFTLFFNAALEECQINQAPSSTERARSYYLRAAQLGESIFSSTTDLTQSDILRALLSAAKCELKLDSGFDGKMKALAIYKKIAKLADPVFKTLSANSLANLFLAIRRGQNIKAWVAENQKSESDMVEFRYGAEHAVTQCHSLRVLKKQINVLNALCIACASSCVSENGAEGDIDALYFSTLAVQIGTPIFGHLFANEQYGLLNSMISAGQIERRIHIDPKGWQRALPWFRQAADLGLLHCKQPCQWQEQLATSIANTALLLSKSDPPFQGYLALWGLHSEHCSPHYGGTAMGGVAAGLLLAREAQDGADLWLRQICPSGVNPAMPEHVQTVLLTVRLRLAQMSSLDQKELLHFWSQHESWPVRFETLEHWLLGHLAVYAPQQLPPLSDDSELLAPWEPDARAIATELGMGQLWQEGRPDRFLADGVKLLSATERAVSEPYYFANLRPSPLIDTRRYCDKPEHQALLQRWQEALHAGDLKPLAEALQLAWLNLMDEQSTGIKRLRNWLISQGIDRPTAWERARTAVLTASCDRLLDEVLTERWALPTGQRSAYRSLENARLTEAVHATNGQAAEQAAMQRNLRFFANASLNHALARDGSSTLDVEPLWDLLQLQRLGVALSTKPRQPKGWSSGQGFDWDGPARVNILAMQNQLLLNVQSYQAARQRGERLPTAVERNEPLQPFATYAREWKRIGWDLDLPSPQEAASWLREGQALVQCHLSENGAVLHALVLRLGPTPDARASREPELSLHELGSQGFNVQTVTQAALDWQLAVAACSDVETLDDDSSYVAAMAQAMAALQALWLRWQQPGHAMQALMHWLHELAPAGVVWVCPQAWSALPWQALWAQAFEETEPLRCVASVGAWVQAQAPMPKESPDAIASPALAPVVLSSLDVWAEGGEAEAQAVARVLGAKPRCSNDLAEVMEALRSTGPVHLAMHGCFDAQDPWRTALVVDQPDQVLAQEAGGMDALATQAGVGDETRSLQTRCARLRVRRLRKGSWPGEGMVEPSSKPLINPGHAECASASQTRDGKQFEPAQLPAWALPQIKNRTDISLGVCESLQEGQGLGDAAYLGAAGLGALLMAAGARSVAGSLWSCDAWSAAVFFSFWYDERRQHPAALALQKAQQRLRNLEEADFLRWVEKHSVPASLSEGYQALSSAQGRCDLARQLGWARPFDHPFCWAAFALLGDAPPLPELKTVPMQDHRTTRAGARLRAWWSRFWKSIFRRSV